MSKNKNNKSLKLNAVLSIIKQLCQICFSLITIPYVTRVLGVNNYGMVSFSSSIIGYFSLFAALGISTYAIRECSIIRGDSEKLNHLSSQLFSINVCSMVIAYIGIIILIKVPYFSSYKSLILIQGLIIFFTTIGTDWVNSVFEDYTYITIRYIVFQIISLISMLLFVKTKDDYLIYALITVFANAGANLINFFYVRKYAKIHFTLKMNIKKHIKPILILFGNALAINIYVNADVTMLGIFNSDYDVGIYTLTSKIYTVIKLVINGIVVVSIPRLSLYYGNKETNKFTDLLKEILSVLQILIIPVGIFMIVLSKRIVVIMGGVDYLEGYKSLIILALTLVIAFMSFYFTNCILIPTQNEKTVLLSTFIGAIVNVILNLYFIPRYNFIGASITTFISETIVMTIELIVIVNKKICSIKIPKNDNISNIISNIVFIVVVIVFDKIVKNNILCIVITSISAASIYLLFLYIMKNSIVTSEINKLKMRK